MKRKLICLLITSTILLGLFTACGGNTADNSTPAATANSKEDSKEDSKATTSANTSTEKPHFELFTTHSWLSDNLEGILTEGVQEINGVTLTMNVAVDNNQLPVMIASGDIMDLTYTSSELSRLSTSDLCLAYNELAEEYGIDWNTSEQSIMNAKSFSQDENYYCILNGFSTQETWDAYPEALLSAGNCGIAVRGDIMDELGIPEILTLEDFFNAMVTVKEAKPDMVPYVLNASQMASNYSALANFIGCVSSGSSLVQKDGEISHYANTQQYYNYLQFMNRMYRADLFLAENFTYTDEAATQEFAINGTAFAYGLALRTADDFNNKTVGSGQEWRQIIVPLTEDTKWMQSGIGWSGIFISKNVKNPEAAAKLVEWLRSDFGQRYTYWGREGDDYDLSPGGRPLFKGDRAEAEKTGDRSLFNISLNWGFEAIVEGLLLYDPVNWPQSIDSNDFIKSRSEFNSKLSLIAPTADTAENQLRVSLLEHFRSEEIKVLLSNTEEEFETAYAELMENAEKIGMSKYEEYGQKAYDELS